MQQICLIIPYRRFHREYGDNGEKAFSMITENIFKTSWKNYELFRWHGKFCCDCIESVSRFRDQSRSIKARVVATEKRALAIVKSRRIVCSSCESICVRFPVAFILTLRARNWFRRNGMEQAMKKLDSVWPAFFADLYQY